LTKEVFNSSKHDRYQCLANPIRDELVQYSLAQRGWSQRRIAKELGVNRETVGRYLRLSKPAISTTGFEDGQSPKPAISITGNLAGKESKPAISIAGIGAGRRSRCEVFAEVIAAKVEAGLSAKRIYQDLVERNAFSDSYQSVQRFVRKLKAAQPQRVWRMETLPGEEVQVDFGLGAPIGEGSGRSGRSWVLRMVLSYSRKAYSEAVLRQDTETFLRCLENGLRSFGGCPLLLNVDNMKSAVLRADWFDPQINPKLADFCRHYGMHVVPCRPRRPEHKGKVERSVAYVRSNALKGRRFRSLGEENLFSPAMGKSGCR
jgi:transposase